MDFDSKQRQNKKNILHIKACGRINTKDGPDLEWGIRSPELGVDVVQCTRAVYGMVWAGIAFQIVTC
jgi:hypothetical protein